MAITWLTRIKTDAKPSVDELMAQVAALQAQLAKKNTITLKASDKGSVSAYGSGRYPVIGSNGNGSWVLRTRYWTLSGWISPSLAPVSGRHSENALSNGGVFFRVFNSRAPLQQPFRNRSFSEAPCRDQQSMLGFPQTTKAKPLGINYFNFASGVLAIRQPDRAGASQSLVGPPLARQSCRGHLTRAAKKPRALRPPSLSKGNGAAQPSSARETVAKCTTSLRCVGAVTPPCWTGHCDDVPAAACATGISGPHFAQEAIFMAW